MPTPDFEKYLEQIEEDAEKAQCPYCQSLDIAEGGEECTRDAFYRSIICGECGKEWTEIYTLTDVEPLEPEAETVKYLVVYTHKNGSDIFFMNFDHDPKEEEITSVLDSWDPETEYLDVRPVDKLKTYTS